VGKTVQTTNLS